MSGANKAKYSLLVVIVVIAAWFLYSALQKSKDVHRDTTTLFNFYYQHKADNPLKAKEALDLILRQDPENQTAFRAMVNWYLGQGDTHTALHFLEDGYRRNPNDTEMAYKLMTLYLSIYEQEKAKAILQHILLSNNKSVIHRATIEYESVYPNDPLSIEAAKYASFIPTITFISRSDFSPVYKKIQEMMRLEPDSARQALLNILSIDSNATEAYVLLGYLELQEKNPHKALPFFIRAFEIKPSASLAMQLGYLYAEMHNQTKAIEYFKYAQVNGGDSLRTQSVKALSVLEQQLTIHSTHLSVAGLITKLQSPEEILMNMFYQNKTSDIPRAWDALHRLLALNPKNIQALKEAAYFATAQHDNEHAIDYWKQAYAIEHNPEYALSIGYLYDGLERKLAAFRYFDLASKTTNQAIHDKAEIAMTNMASSQFKFLPKPYFMEFYTAPFYFSRFDLGVLPTILRSGITVNEKHHTEVYLSYRRTKDNRSTSGIQGLIIQNSISQIFEDNVAIYSVGFRGSPWPTIPLQAFIEAGSAEDLVYRNRPVWKKDLRGGLVYYNAWGEKPTYTDSLEFPWKWVATLYADLIYYSRYDNNVIGTTWFRPGLRAATFQSASLDLYVANYYIVDKNKEFFNNTYSVGPGIAIRPTNRANVVFRFESLQGYYIPVRSPTPNPFRSRYYNNIAMVEFFTRF